MNFQQLAPQAKAAYPSNLYGVMKAAGNRCLLTWIQFTETLSSSPLHLALNTVQFERGKCLTSFT